MGSRSGRNSGRDQSATAQSVASLLLVIHLFLVLVALSSNLVASPLQLRLLQMFRPYLQGLHLDPDATRFHLTHADRDDVDHRFEVLPSGADSGDDEAWQRVTAGAFRVSENYQRLQRLARWQAVQTREEVANDAAAAEVARAVAEHVVQSSDTAMDQIRCRRHLLQPWEIFAERPSAPARNPDDASYFETAYAAHIVEAEGRVLVKRITLAGDSALPDTSGETTPPADVTPPSSTDDASR